MPDFVALIVSTSAALAWASAPPPPCAWPMPAHGVDVYASGIDTCAAMGGGRREGLPYVRACVVCVFYSRFCTVGHRGVTLGTCPVSHGEITHSLSEE